jgi:hypothetical protein
MYTQNNVTHLFISPAALSTAEAPAVSRQIGIKYSGETLCDAGLMPDGTTFKVLYLNAKGEVVESPFLEERGILSKIKVTPSALAPQISHIGFNGTDGDIVETNSGNYLVTLGLKDMMKMIGNKRLYKFGDYTAPLTAVKSDIAIGLADSLALNQSKDAWVRVIVEVLAGTAAVAGNALDNNATVVSGGKWISVAAALTYAVGTPVVVGDFIRLGAGPLVATAITDNVYKIVEVSGLNVKLDRPVTDASGLYTAAANSAEIIPSATALLPATLWGIQLTGNDANAPFEVGKYGANLVYFSVGVSTDFQTTPVRLTQTPAVGNGTYKQIAQLDWELQGNGREKYRIAEYPVNFIPNILSTETPVAIYNIKFSNIETEVIGSRAESKIELIFVATNVACENDLDTVFAL